MKKVMNDRVEINYSVYGKKSPTLLFVHGSYNDQTYWNDQINHFKDKYKVVTPDLGGHGKSGTGRDNWTIEKFGGDVLAILKQLELEDVILIGHSMGADAALEAAVKYPGPIIGFIAVDYFKDLGSSFPEDLLRQIMDGLNSDFENTSENYARTGLLTKETPAEVTDRVVEAYRTADPGRGIKSITSLFDYAKREAELLQKLNVKVHLLNVDYMPTNEDALKKFGIEYDIHPIHGTSHFPMIEIPDELNKALEKAISEITAGVTT